MYAIETTAHIDKRFLKLAKKDPKRMQIITKKIGEIIENPQHYKNLRAPLQNWKRVHIDKHFVLTFSVNEENKIITIEDFDYHNNIYH